MTDKLNEYNPNLLFEVGGTGYHADEILQVHDSNWGKPLHLMMPIGTTVSFEALRAALKEVAALEQKLEGFEAISLVPVGYGVDEQRGWGEYVAIRKSDWDKIVAADQALAAVKI